MTVSNVAATNTGTGQSTQQARKSLDENYSNFLLLLTTQLKNQDPNQPVDTNQLTSQIAQLSQVEQSINTNSKLDNLLGLLSQSQASTAVSYIGRQVDAEGKQLELRTYSSEDADGKTTTVKNATVVYNLAAEAKNVTVTISDSTGKTVYSADGLKHAGRNQLAWDGTMANGEKAPAGIYTFSVAAKDTAGKDVEATTYTTGVVTSLETVDGVNSVSTGKIAIPLDKIKLIYTAGTNPSA